jgi:hypothetical protein
VGAFFEAILNVFELAPFLPTVAQVVDEVPESLDGAGLVLWGMNGAIVGCICGIELDLIDTGVGGIGIEGIIGGITVAGLAGKFSVLKMRGKEIRLKPRSMKPCSQDRDSIRVNRDA